MKIYETLEDWRAEGSRRFGADFEQWKFRCPVCGRVTTVIEFKQYGGEPDDAYINCIGRFNGHMKPHKKGDSNEQGCDWAAYGFFKITGVAVKHNGKTVDVFDFAEVSE